jgi:hypothetical protein
MNNMWGPGGRWLGQDKHPDSALVYAECATEHTEAMRRLGFDCLLPYMYSGWTGMRGEQGAKCAGEADHSAVLAHKSSG